MKHGKCCEVRKSCAFNALSRARFTCPRIPCQQTAPASNRVTCPRWTLVMGVSHCARATLTNLNNRTADLLSSLSIGAASHGCSPHSSPQPYQTLATVCSDPEVNFQPSTQPQAIAPGPGAEKAGAFRGSIRHKLAERVLKIVDGCTDTDKDRKPPWRVRKEQRGRNRAQRPICAARVDC